MWALLFVLIFGNALSEEVQTKAGLVHESYFPTYYKGDQIVRHKAYTLKYNEKHEQADWVAYHLTVDMIRGKAKRTNDFRMDPLVKTGTATLEDYKGSGYDRGHLAPAADMALNPATMSESFYLSNMSPQTPGFNRGIWRKLETDTRSWTLYHKGSYIVTGPILKEGLSQIGPSKITVPKYFYKVILETTPPQYSGIAFVLPNEKSQKSVTQYARTINQVEEITGLDFFPVLSDEYEEKVEAQCDIKNWLHEVDIGSVYRFSSKAPKRQLSPTPKKKSAPKGVIVYIAGSGRGKKYHRKNCRTLSRSHKVAISLEEARRRGYTPCKVCNP